MNEEYKKNEFYESLLQLDSLISDLDDYYDDEDIVGDIANDLDICYQELREKYQLLYNGLPIAIGKELEWYNSNASGVTNTDYEEGYIKGLKAAVSIFNQIRNQY